MRKKLTHVKLEEQILRYFNMILEDLKYLGQTDVCPYRFVRGWDTRTKNTCKGIFPKAGCDSTEPCPCHTYSKYYLIKRVKEILEYNGYGRYRRRRNERN